jgi:Flp pilus assembly CpaF family ATPase
MISIDDPAITDIIVNEDGRVWFEAHGRGLFDGGFSIPASQREGLIGTVAVTPGVVANADNPIVISGKDV